MPLSNYLPSSRLIQPGVCTSSTRPASPFEGQAIFETDTDRMLIWNGTTWVIPNQTTTNPGGLELVKTQSYSNVANALITNAFSSTYDNYRVLISFNSTVTDPRYMHFRMSNGGSDSSASYYSKSLWWSMNAGGGSAVDSDIRTDRFCLGTVGPVGQSGHNIVIDLFNPGVAKPTQFSGTGAGLYSGSYHTLFTAAGNHESSVAYDGINVFPTAANITGTITVYGYRK